MTSTGLLLKLTPPECVPSDSPLDRKNYLLQSIDVAAREKKTQSVVRLSDAAITAMSFDSVSGDVLLAYVPASAAEPWSSFGPAQTGYRVELHSLE